jgi:hypothetical protein
MTMPYRRSIYLQPRSGKYDEFTAWKKVESDLHRVLLTAAEKPFIPS